MRKVHLLLGGNIGDRVPILQKAVEFIIQKIGALYAQSSIYETAAWGKLDQNSFLNQVLVVETALSADTILETIQSIESELGRVRFEKWGERIIDIDILFIEDLIIDKKNLQIPHPHLHQRLFTLIPLNELSPHFIHPIFSKSVSILLQECPDKLKVKKYL